MTNELMISYFSAGNFKNEMLIRYHKGVKIAISSEEPLVIDRYLPSIPGDGKDICDLCAANLNCHIHGVVRSGFNIDNPKCQALAICRGKGVANTIVLFGKIIGKQPELKSRRLQSIKQLFDFEYKTDGVTVRKIANTGDGKFIKLEPLEVVTKFDYAIMNKDALDPMGRPNRKTINPVDKCDKPHSAGDPGVGDATRQLSMMEYVRDVHIRNYGMDSLQDVQPDVGIGGNILLQKLQKFKFSEALLLLQSSTKWTPLEWTLQDLLVGHAFPVWGGGTNRITDQAKAYITNMFMQGVGGDKVAASEAEQRMQEDFDPVTKLPLFNADTYLDEQQIIGIYATCKKPKPVKVSGTKKKAASTLTAADPIAGVDFDDQNNGEDQQVHEAAVQDMQAMEETAAVRRDAIQIENALNDLIDSDDCPIRINGVNLCELAEESLFFSGALKKFSDDQRRAVAQKVEPDERKRRKYLKNDQLLTKAILFYVKKECPQKCCTLYR